MATNDPPVAPLRPRRYRWLPFGDPSRGRRLVKVLAWLAGIALVVAALELLGVDVAGWFSSMWDALTGIGFGYLVAGFSLQTLQTTLTALGWFFILRAAYPRAPRALPAGARDLRHRRRAERLPAGQHRHVRDAAHVRGDHPLRELRRRRSAARSCRRSSSRSRGRSSTSTCSPPCRARSSASSSWRTTIPVLTLAIIAGAVLLIVMLVRIFRRKLHGVVSKGKQGAAILGRPREFLVRVVLPSFGAWLAKLGVIAVFLAGYGIAVTFHTIMSVMGGNSIANTVSVTPGGVGVNQAANVASLSDVTDAATATAYSLGQQLAITAWNIAFAIALVIWAFGWAGGKTWSSSPTPTPRSRSKSSRRSGPRAARRSASGRPSVCWASRRAGVRPARRRPSPVAS